jgi:adenylyltransferase/sulfurtransferase
MSNYAFEERYSRQIRLPQIGRDGQGKLASARVLVIGMGGLGSPAALYLASAGVGHLVLSDFDRVELSNLQRQVIHTESAIDQPKALSAKETIASLNSDVDVTAIDWQLADDELIGQVRQADVVLDCSDNFDTRFAINAACHASGRPLVSGAAIRFDGQLTTFDFRQEASPCYHCLFGGEGFAESCAAEGILSPVVGVIGVMQALEAVKLITGAGETLTGRLLLFDGLSSSFQQVRYARDPGCNVCSH